MLLELGIVLNEEIGLLGFILDFDENVGELCLGWLLGLGEKLGEDLGFLGLEGE
jgi:hypothetical protein